MTSDDDDTRSGAEQAIAKWLAGQGYPLEMTVAREFRRTARTVWVSEYYADSELGAQREIDVIAQFNRRMNRLHWWGRVEVVVECKLAREKPWVMFTSEQPMHDIAFCTQRTAANRIAAERIQHYASAEGLAKPQPFTQPSRLGYGLTQAFTNGADAPYSAAMAVAKAVAARLMGYLDNPQHIAANDDWWFVAFPVIVIDGLLMECYLPEGGQEPIVREVGRGVLAWRHPVVGLGHPYTIIDVVTASALPAFVDEVGDAADWLLSAFAEDRRAWPSGRAYLDNL
jgi:hypothetical protein